MAVFEPDNHGFEAKAQFDRPDKMDMELNAQEPILPNGDNAQDASLASVNTSAHYTNSHQDVHDFEPPILNGIGNKEDHQKDTQSTTDTSSTLPSSGATFDTQLPLSSQSVPDEVMEHPTMSLDSEPLDPSPAVGQQPTSDLREETQPVIMEQAAEIKKRKENEDLIGDLELVKGSKADAADPVMAVGDPEPQTELLPPPGSEEPRAHSPAVPEPVEPLQPTQAAPAALMSKVEPPTIPTADLPHHPPVPVPEDADAEVLIDPVDPATSVVMASEESEPLLKTEESSVDQIMQDAPASPTKVAREREDDEMEDGPVAKRSKFIEDASSSAQDFKVPERPVIDTKVNGAHIKEPPRTAPMTPVQHKALLRVMQNVKRVQASASFRLPVDPVTLNIPNYPTIIKRPMDLRTLEENLKANKYPSVDAFVSDFNLIVENCFTFNGPTHSVTKLAYDMQTSFQKQMEKVPGPDVTESVPEKKKGLAPPPPKAAPPRRESRSLPGSARSPNAAGSPTTFALAPSGTPLIRRDSTLGDGRPKREIHPPAPRDLPYANQKPKKKKYQLELKYCDKVLSELTKPKYSYCNFPFLMPVDPVALNIPTYHSIIKKPMDFGTMRTKLDQGQYENAKEFESDVRQVFQNCYRFNHPGDAIDTAGHQLENIFDDEWAKKRDYIEANTPGSGPQSAGSSGAEDSDDEDEEDDEEEDNDAELTQLQKSIAAMSKQVEMLKKKKASPPVANKKAGKGAKPARKEIKKAAPVKAEKKGSSKPMKKEKAPYVTYEQKQDISNRINSLPESKMATALKIIRDNMPNLKGVQEDELELDIDELSDEVLHKLLLFVRKHAPRADDAPVRPAPVAASGAPSRKKNKPMSKTEQELRIAQVQSGLSAFREPGASTTYDDPAPDVESSDGDESSESEEE